jgi:two-component system, chemotaxis family, protein-glutamate methylesterase/glutaminase
VAALSPRSRDLIVVGASAGGVEALQSFVAHLPPDLPAAVAVALHLPAGGTSALPSILNRAGPLRSIGAAQATRLQHGMVYVAPPNHHLLVVDGELVLSHGPTENGHRPAINPLFRSAAIAGGPRVIGVILSGVLDDGVAGLVSIVNRGGLAVVQEPSDALYPGMPEQALRHVNSPYVLPVAQMGPLLAHLVRETVDLASAPEPSPLLTMENDIAGSLNGTAEGGNLGPMSGFTCPDCNGTLVEVEPGEARYRCRVGHAWSAGALLAAQSDALEKALWIALRTLDEKVALATRMRAKVRQDGNLRLALRYERLVEESMEAAEALRKYLTAEPVMKATETEVP